MESLISTLIGLPAFGAYFGIAITLFWLFKQIYSRITPYHEWQLIKENQNTAAAIALGGAMIGFSIALASAASNSVSFVDFLVWAVVALIAQLVAFVIVRFTLMPNISARIENDEVSAGIVVASVSISIGLLNAACMTY